MVGKSFSGARRPGKFYGRFRLEKLNFEEFMSTVSCDEHYRRPVATNRRLMVSGIPSNYPKINIDSQIHKRNIWLLRPEVKCNLNKLEGYTVYTIFISLCLHCFIYTKKTSQVVNDIELFASSGYYKRDKKTYNTDENWVHTVDHEQISFHAPHKKVTVRLFSCGHAIVILH